MRNIDRNLFILITIILQIQFLFSHPSPKLDPQRTFLRCQFSAVACKRNLDYSKINENFLSIIHSNDLRKCIEQHKSIRYCLLQTTQSIDK